MEFDPNIRVEIAPSVYPPSEDSHLLLRSVQVRAGERVLEIGTGSGFIALHAAEFARVVATDVNPEAVCVARRNAKANGLELAVVRTDLFRGLRRTFDVIVFNPPYLVEPIGGDWEDRAWQGGATGEDIVLQFLEEAPNHLAPGGRLYLLIPSNRERAMAVVREKFHATLAGKRPMFYETLFAFELTTAR